MTSSVQPRGAAAIAVVLAGGGPALEDARTLWPHNGLVVGFDLATAALISTCIGGPCMLVWTVWGASIDRVLHRPRARQLFSYAMAVLVVLTAAWMLR